MPQAPDLARPAWAQRSLGSPFDARQGLGKLRGEKVGAGPPGGSEEAVGAANRGQVPAWGEASSGLVRPGA